jgi:hypothetical protein
VDGNARVGKDIREKLPELAKQTTYLWNGFYVMNFISFPLLKPTFSRRHSLIEIGVRHSFLSALSRSLSSPHSTMSSMPIRIYTTYPDRKTASRPCCAILLLTTPLFPKFSGHRNSRGRVAITTFSIASIVLTPRITFAGAPFSLAPSRHSCSPCIAGM